MMTKKTFVAVAKVLETTMMPVNTRAALIEAFAAIFKASNPNFDKAKFAFAATPAETNY